MLGRTQQIFQAWNFLYRKIFHCKFNFFSRYRVIQATYFFLNVCHTFPQSTQGLPLTLTVAYKALSGLLLPILPTSSACHLPLVHSVPVTLVFWLFQDHAKLFPNSRPWHHFCFYLESFPQALYVVFSLSFSSASFYVRELYIFPDHSLTILSFILYNHTHLFPSSNLIKE